MNEQVNEKTLLEKMKEKGKAAVNTVSDNKVLVSSMVVGGMVLGFMVSPTLALKQYMKTSIEDPKTGLLWRTCKPIKADHLIKITKELGEGVDFPTALKRVGLIK